MERNAFKRLLWSVLAVAVVLAGVIGVCMLHPQSRKPLASADLGDGRVLQVEAVTYGTKHVVGDARSVILQRFRPWLPKLLVDFFEPKSPQTTIGELEHPALVVWVNAIDANTRTNIDCQGIRAEFVDEHGDLYEEHGRSWFGRDKFWRVGHVFYSYPRTQKTLTLIVTPLRKGHEVRMEIQNPMLASPASWSGNALPLEKKIGDVTVALTGLELRTNGAAKTKNWETQSVYWNPVWQLSEGTKQVTGWDPAEWTAEDPSGNTGQHLSIHQPALRYSATFYPSATNASAASLAATLPEMVVTNTQSIIWWNQTNMAGTNEIVALGFFPPGTYVFSEGKYQTNPPVKMGPVRNGAPSGWTGSSHAITPLKMQMLHGHYSTNSPVIYLHVSHLEPGTHLGLRLRGEDGKYWLAKPEPQGSPDGVHPFLVDLPPNVTKVTPEIVLLKPVEVEFTVKTPPIESAAK